MPALTVAANANRLQGQRGCRVSERFSCDVPVSCQPPSLLGGKDIKWQARVKDVSSGGLCLMLQRRFERGAGLAIDLPAADGTEPCTIFARVVHVRSEHGGLWALGCVFVSPLSEEELHALLRFAAAEAFAPPKATRPSAIPKGNAPAKVNCLPGVFIQGVMPDGSIVEGYVETLLVGIAWPLRAGRTFLLRYRGPAGTTPQVRIKVDACRIANKYKILECTFLGAPPTDILQLLAGGNDHPQ